MAPASSRSSSRRDGTDELAHQILRHIRETRLSPGAHLTAQGLSERFKISRFPVGRALQVLAEKGLLRHEPNRGYFVGEVSAETLAADVLSSESALDDVYYRIADDLLRGEIPRDVSERYLRDRYNLTHTQTTSVLGRIAQEGWAERRRGYGWSFSPMLTTPESLEQTYRVRMALEPAALMEPSYRLDPADLARCRSVEERLLAGAVETDSAELLHERGVRFHETIVGASGNPFFLDTIQRINRVRRLLSYRGMTDRRRYRRQCEEHLEILRLLDAERNEDAAEALRAHLAQTIDGLREIGARLRTPAKSG